MAAEKSKDAAAAPPAVEKPNNLELYGKATVATILVLFAIEMVVLVPLVRSGMDISPFTRWIDSTFGSTLTAVRLF
jgi:hypothetical protein